MKGLSLVLCLLIASSSLAAITFDGVTTSFAQFDRWQPLSSSRGIVGSLSLRFKTHNRDSLILYQDDGSQDYLSIELSNGKILTTFGSNGKTVLVEIGQDLDDMNWHIFKMQINFDRVTLTLDKSLTKTAKGLSINNNALKGSSGYLYIGGLPTSLSLASLSWPGVVFKKGFVGCIKKFKKTSGANSLEDAVLVKSKGVKSGCLNECRARNPCLNKGKCINRYPKAQCDCTGTGFEGEKCEKEIIQLHLTKKDYVIYDMSSTPAATQTDHISIQFKTSKKNSILLKTSFAHDYLIIKLFKGSLMLEWNLGSGRLEMVIGSGRIHDNQWHHVDIKRTKRIVTTVLDDSPEVERMTPPRHSTFNMHGGESKVYIGGDKDSASRDQFVGCLKKVMFNNIELISKLKGKDPRLTLQGKALWSCPETPVTTTPGTTTVRSTIRNHYSTTNRNKNSADREPRYDRKTKTKSDPKITTKSDPKITTKSDPKTKNKSDPKTKTKSDPKTKTKSDPKTKTKSDPKTTTKSDPKTTTIPVKTKNNQCSPNDVRCVLNTFPTSRPKPTPSRAPSKPSLCKMFNNCSKGAVTTNRKQVPTSSVVNRTTTASEPDIQGLEGADNELGNIPTAIGLVVGSIVLFVFCAVVSIKLKKLRDRKLQTHHHEVTIEHREVEEMVNTHVYHPDDHVTKS